MEQEQEPALNEEESERDGHRPIRGAAGGGGWPQGPGGLYVAAAPEAQTVCVLVMAARRRWSGREFVVGRGVELGVVCGLRSRAGSTATAASEA